MNTLIRTLLLLTAPLAFTAAHASCPQGAKCVAADVPTKATLSIGTGGTGGVYYPLGGAMASILSKNVPGWQVTAEVTGASVDNLKLINTGKADVGFSMADTAWEAYTGLDKFKENKVPARTLMVLYPNRMHIVTVEGTGINTLQDLKGRRISVGSPGSGTEIMANRVLEVMNITDIKRERLSVAESVNAIKDRKIEAFFWVGGLPTAAITDLATTPNIKIKFLDHAEAVEALNKKWGPLYVKDQIPQKTYQGMDKPAQIAGVWNILAVNEKMSDAVAYSIVKTLFENRNDLIAAHKEAENISLEFQRMGYSPLPFHPGAAKYFAEKGIKQK